MGSRRLLPLVHSTCTRICIASSPWGRGALPPVDIRWREGEAKNFLRNGAVIRRIPADARDGVFRRTSFVGYDARLVHTSPSPALMRFVSPFVPRALLAAVLLTACAPTTQHTYVAPTFQSIVSSTEERQGNPPAHLLFVENRSTVPVVVFSTSLT